MRALVRFFGIMPLVGCLVFIMAACTDWDLPVDLSNQSTTQQLAAEVQTKTRLENFRTTWKNSLNELNQAKKDSVSTDSLNVIRTRLDSLVLEYDKIKEELKSYR
jgi:hypothetical protein